MPHTIDAVLIAAQRGSGKRASLYTDYTFGVWDHGVLVTIAKAYSGLTDAEIREVDTFIRRNMVERFGPVRTVKPELVFELAFEGLNLSKPAQVRDCRSVSASSGGGPTRRRRRLIRLSLSAAFALARPSDLNLNQRRFGRDGSCPLQRDLTRARYLGAVNEQESQFCQAGEMRQALVCDIGLSKVKEFQVL